MCVCVCVCVGGGCPLNIIKTRNDFKKRFSESDGVTIRPEMAKGMGDMVVVAGENFKTFNDEIHFLRYILYKKSLKQNKNKEKSKCVYVCVCGAEVLLLS